jgi:DNA-binding transcriptional LysR family regulator
LFTRTNRSVVLTSAGREVLDHVEELLDAAADVHRTARRLTRARGPALLLGCTRGPLTHVATALCAALPAPHEVTVTTVEGADSIDAVHSATVDAVLTWVDPESPLPESLDLVLTGPVQHQRVVLSASHVHADAASLVRADLAGEPVVGVTTSLDQRRPGVAIEDVLEQVARGAGIAYVSPCEAAWFHHPGVHDVAVTDGAPIRAALLWHRDSGGAALQALVDVARAGVVPPDPTAPPVRRDAGPERRGARRTGEDVRWISVSSSASDSPASTAASPGPPSTPT